MSASRPERLLAGVVLLLALGAFLACSGDDPSSNGAPPNTGVPAGPGPVLDEDGRLGPAPAEASTAALREAAADAAAAKHVASLQIDYPQTGSIFPPEFVPPTFLWRDDAPARRWLVRVDFSDGSGSITTFAAGAPPPEPAVDERAFGPTNEPWRGTEEQRAAKSWTPTEDVWSAMKTRSTEATATVTFAGLDADDRILSLGSVEISTSKDPVGAPIFYRDVPLMPSAGEEGRIQPLGDKAIPLIAWRLRDVSRPESKLVLTGISSCGNCHSFSADGGVLGMDVDGPSGDKGMYAIKPVTQNMVINYDDVITWNSFPEKPENHRTIGFLSRVSPDGNHVVSTVNEAIYAVNFTDYRILQVFYPTRGILAAYSRLEDTMRSIPGADDPAYVHCGAVWSPDGEDLIFMRAPARDPYEPGRPLPTHPNDPNELPMQFDLYRIPFNGGRGGKAVPVVGASQNGMSNTFPKVSPDGKWIVFVKCRNGMLLRPDGRLWIVPFEGGEAREMRCNLPVMNSWHSFSPNGRWMVFTSKSNRPYTQAFLTHIDEDGNDSPAILIPNNTAGNRAVNLPEFLNASYDALDTIDIPALQHHRFLLQAESLMKEGRYADAVPSLEKAIEADAEFARAHVAMGFTLAHMRRLDEARRYFARALEIDPASDGAALNLALVSVDLGRPADANEALEHLEQIAPGHPGLPSTRQRAREMTEQIQARIAEGRDALERNPQDGPSHGRIADLYERVGEVERAARHLERAVALMPEDAVAATRLAWLLATAEDPHLRDGYRAVGLAQRAVALTKRAEIDPLDALAAAQAEAGRFEEAVEAAEQALALAQKSSASVASDIERRLALYRDGRTYRVP